MPMTSRQLAELVRRAAAATAERAAPVEAPAQTAVAEKVIEPPPVLAPRPRAAHQPIAGTLRLSRPAAGSVEARPSLQVSAEGAAAPIGEALAPPLTKTSPPQACAVVPDGENVAISASLPPASAPAEALADERRERRDRRLARHGLSMADVTAVTRRLMEHWPAVFGERRRALAVGIHHKILAAMPDCDRAALSFALRQWCSHPAYLRALATGRHRHSLAGEDVADISRGDRAWARQQLDELRQQRAARQPSVSGGLR